MWLWLKTCSLEQPRLQGHLLPAESFQTIWPKSMMVAPQMCPGNSEWLSLMESPSPCLMHCLLWAQGPGSAVVVLRLDADTSWPSFVLPWGSGEGVGELLWSALLSPLEWDTSPAAGWFCPPEGFGLSWWQRYWDPALFWSLAWSLCCPVIEKKWSWQGSGLLQSDQ